jgi:hypothetical protein
MRKLSPAGFNRARDYLLSKARPLEKTVFEMEFEEGNTDDVLTQLEKFQNLDGGFGRALEPDLRTPTSSALCSEMGLRYLADWEIPAEHPMVRSVVKYLIDLFDAKTWVWRVIPVDANDYPHAPWWHDEEGSLASSFDHFMVIPRAGILASLYHYAELVPEDWLLVMTERTVKDIEDLETERFGQGGDTLVYALRLTQAPGLARQFHTRLAPFLREVADSVVKRDPRSWSSYVAPPLKLAPTPASPIADLLADDIEANLDYLIEKQTSEGTWEPTWTWGEFYPDQWAQVKEEWRGILTLETLITLQAFGRIAT